MVIFVVSTLNHCSDRSPSIVFFEFEEEEINKAKIRAAEIDSEAKVEWICSDFFALFKKLKDEEKFDVAFGNPPFIRFQYFDVTIRERAFDLLREAGYHPTKLANAWTAFIELSIELLKDGGRLAMVVPAEILQVKYAAELRSRLSKQFEHIVLVGFRKLVFPEIQQEVLLLLAEGKRAISQKSSDIHTIEFTDGDELLNGDLAEAIAHVESKHSRNGMKWTSLFLSNKIFKALDEAEQAQELTPLGQLASIDIGVVTGRNSFFVLTEDLKNQIGSNGLTVPILGHTSALKSIIYKPSDLKEYSNHFPAYLLALAGKNTDEFSQHLKEYIKSGEQEEVHKGFKCRIRHRWFDVPSVYVPDAFMFRQIHRFPLFVVNDSGATSTDTIHRVQVKNGISTRNLAATFYNSLTFAWAEVCGRSYGGGVLELEPMEAEELPIPHNPDVEIDVEKVDTLLRTGHEIEALDYVDNIVLKGTLGFDNPMIKNIRIAWDELRNRRMNRR